MTSIVFNISKLTSNLVPSNTKLLASSQLPAATLVLDDKGNAVGISAFAQAVINMTNVLNNSSFDCNSMYFPQPVSTMTLYEIANIFNNLTESIGAVYIKYSDLALLMNVNPKLYMPNTIFSADIQCAMMTDLAILSVSQSAINLALNKNLVGISDALAYYAAFYDVNPYAILDAYRPNNTTSCMVDLYPSLKKYDTSVRNATVYAVVNGLPASKGGLGLFQGFNSWKLYPSNCIGYNQSGIPIQTITIPGRGNNPGLTADSKIPINAINSAIVNINTQTTTRVLNLAQLISNIYSTSAANAQNSLQVICAKLLYSIFSSNIAASGTTINTSGNVASATSALELAYAEYELYPDNVDVEAALNKAITDYIAANIPVTEIAVLQENLESNQRLNPFPIINL